MTAFDRSGAFSARGTKQQAGATMESCNYQ
jgi:hypothetical protein